MQAWTPPGALQGGREDGENDCRQLDSLVGQVCAYQLRLKGFWHRDCYWRLLHLTEGPWAYRHNLAWNLFKNHVKSNGKFWNSSRCGLFTWILSFMKEKIGFWGASCSLFTWIFFHERKNWFLRSQLYGSDDSQMITVPNLIWDCSAPNSLSWHIRTYKPTFHKEALDGFLAFI